MTDPTPPVTTTSAVEPAPTHPLEPATASAGADGRDREGQAIGIATPPEPMVSVFLHALRDSHEELGWDAYGVPRFMFGHWSFRAKITYSILIQKSL